ncbi:unnamed protein product [Rhizoctonia solani]|uniref:F-box-like domain protein n=1 Tax=Rhizoctonia solani TaxID=456999 RepID=A0A8H3BXP4_9AGAM|nr:unnamed protein product [Rhizoctonia solani]
MLEQLRSAGDNLRAAWDDYLHAYSAAQNISIPRNPSHPKASPEFYRQLDTELTFLSSCEAKMQEIKVAINRARHYSMGLAPIHSLPSEILSRTFQFVLAQRCDLHKLSSDNTYYPRYPDKLAHVCSLWRQVAISCCSLWCHIDLSPYEPRYVGLLDRAQTYATRAGKLPIELHVAESIYDLSKKVQTDYDDLYEFISSISNRVEALNSFIDTHFWEFHRSVFGKLLPCQHPKLLKLVLRSQYNFNTFIHAEDFNGDQPNAPYEGFALNITNNQIEDSFAPLTVLHLQGLFPLWSSVAYHGLVDLRLLSTDVYWSTIKEAELISILKSSPGLRILHFGLRISDPTPGTEQISLVHFQDLRVVKLFPDFGGSGACPTSVLRLLAPGSKPLWLSFDGSYISESTSIAVLEKFLSRSRVGRFYTCSIFPPISMFLRHSAHLEYVVFESYDLSLRKKVSPTWLQADGIASLPRLQSLHFTSSTLLEEDLHSLLAFCPNGIVLYSCQVGRTEGSAYVQLNEKELSDIFPTVRSSDHPPYPLENPTANWDLLD